MLVIRPTGDGRLRLADRRRSGTADTEADARRILFHWGYTDLSINKALVEMKQAEGTLSPLRKWRVVRPTDQSPETAAPPAEPGTPEAEPAAVAQKEEPMEKPTRKRRKRVTEAPAEGQADTQPEAPAAPAPEPGQEQEPRPAGRAGRPRRKAARAAAEPPLAEESRPEAPEAEPVPEAAPRRGGKRARAASSAPAEAATPAAGVTTPAVEDADPLSRAVRLFAEGARALRSIEGETLPFARGPWTQLREQADHILACLQGRRSPED